MRCPYCRENRDKVIDSRGTDGDQVIRRRRQCLACQKRFTTYEHIEANHRLWVIKKDGTRVPYDRQKVLGGLQKACYKRPVSAQEVERLVDEVEEEIFRQYDREVSAAQIGQAVTERLKRLDQVAYVRFASVYKQFRDLDDLLDEVRDVLGSDTTDHPDQGRLFPR